MRTHTKTGTILFAALTSVAGMVVTTRNALGAAQPIGSSYSDLERSFLNVTRRTAPIYRATPSTWYDRQVHYPETIVNPADSSQLIQYFGGGNHFRNDTYSIGRATGSISNPFQWTISPNPMIGPGSSVHSGRSVVGPSYVFFNTSDNQYWMYFTDYPSSGRSIYLAKSGNGIDWNEQGQVLQPHTFGPRTETDAEVAGIIRDGSVWYMYYSYRESFLGVTSILPGIRVATSSNGITWNRVTESDGSPREAIHVGPSGTYDSQHIEGSQAFKIGATYVLFYSAFDGSHYVSALASSSSPVSGFVKAELNPVFVPSDNGYFWDHNHISTSVIAGLNGRNYIYYQGTSSPTPDPGDYSEAIWDMGGATMGDPPNLVSGAFVNHEFDYGISDGQYFYRPTGTGWVFEGNSGIQANGSPFSSIIKANYGTTSFLQTKGDAAQDSAIYQDINFQAAGDYIISLKAAQRFAYNGQTQTFAVQVDGVTSDTITPLRSNSLYAYSARIRIPTAGVHRIRLLSMTPYGNDATALIDNIKLYLPRQAPSPNVSLYRAYHYAGCSGDHFLTPNPAEIPAGWQSDGVIARCWSSSGDGRVRLYRLSNVSSSDHLYTTSMAERASAIAAGWTSETTPCWIYPSRAYNGLTPLSRFYTGGCRTEHVYSATDIAHDGTESRALSAGGWDYEGVTGYVDSNQYPK